MALRQHVLALGSFLAVTLHAASGSAWTFPEHIRIGQASLEQLATSSPETPRADANQSLLVLWSHAKRATPRGSSRSYPLCPSISDDSATCFGLGSLAAIAADHSCSSEDLLANLPLPWVLDVLKAAEDLGKELDNATGIAGREDMRRRTHVMFQGVDKQYLARAQVNGAHFQLARSPRAADLHAPTLDEYISQSTQDDQETNATALYIQYHLAALALARFARHACTTGAADDCATTALHTLATESFALHFLEDSFSSGHFVGTWGAEDFRFGTHDAYSTRGIDAMTWSGRSYAAYGDAFLSWPKDNKELSLKGAADPPVNLTLVAEAVAASLEQVAVVFRSPQPPTESALTKELADGRTFDICTQRHVPKHIGARISSPGLRALVKSVLELEPIPSARSPEAPRFRGEEGVFFGPGIMLEGGHAWQNRSEALPHRPPSGFGGRFRAGLRAGYGLGGVATTDMEDQLLLDGGFVAEQYDNQNPLESQSFLGGYGRIRAPFVFLPILEPLFVLPFAVAKNTWGLSQLSWAANGGLGGWQRNHSFGKSGRWSWQLSLLRDISFLGFYRRGATSNSTRTDVWRYAFTSSFVTLRHRFPFAGADWAVSSDVIVDLGFMIGWRTEALEAGTQRVFAGPNLSVAMGAKVFP